MKLKSDANNTVDDNITYFSKTLISIAEESIPKTSSNKKHNKSWFNDDCKTAIRSRKAALRKFNLEPSAENLNNFRIHRAKTRRVIKSSMKTSWRNYVNKLKSSSKSKKVCIVKSHNTAVGPDEIHYEFLKQLPSCSLDFLLQAFNEVWVSGKFPTSWKQATMIPIPKPGKDNTEPSNYRPIALTSCLCKTLERMINTRLIWFLESNGLITNFQCGLRSKRSTVDHLVRLETFVREAFIKKEHLTAVFFDLEKAYDTTWKYGIMRDLSDFGLKGRLPHFIDNFFLLDLSVLAKKDTPSHVYIQKFNEIKDEYSYYTAVYTDGSKDNDRVGCGLILNNLSTKQRLPRNASIFTAEVTAIDLALDTIAESDDGHFIIFSDSLSVLLSLHNKKMDNPLILLLLQKLHYLSCAHKTIHFCWIPSHIGIRGNEAADMAAKESLDQDITISQVPYTDLKSHINFFISRKWQERWSSCRDNKLFQIKPTLGEWPPGCRRSRKE